MDNSTNTSLVQFTYKIDEHTNRITFTVLFVLQMMSLCAYLLIFYQFAINPNLYRSIYNNSILCLLIISFLYITIPLSISEAYFHRSYVVPSSNIFCGIWNWLQYSLDVSNLHLMAFNCVERHVFIFYSASLRKQYIRRLFHYLPLVISIVYAPVFYLLVIFFADCRMAYDFTQLLCTWPCYFDIWPLTVFDLFFNTFIPMLMIPVFSMALFLRILWQKRSMRLQIFKWKRDRKMTLQLLFISLLYVFFWLPPQVFALINTFYMIILPDLQSNFIDNFVTFVHLLIPCVCLLSFPEMLKKIYGRSNRVEVELPLRRKNIRNPSA